MFSKNGDCQRNGKSNHMSLVGGNICQRRVAVVKTQGLDLNEGL